MKRVSLLKTKLLLLVLACCVGLLIFALIRMTEIRNIEVIGLNKLTTDKFLSYFDMDGIRSNTYLFDFFEKHNSRKIPFVGKYDITIKDRHTISFEVYENEIIACVNVMGSYFSFDKDGTVLASSSERPAGIPIVYGFEFDEIILYEELSVQRQSMFDTVLQIVKLLHEYNIPIEELWFNEFKEVTCRSGELIIQIGKRDDYDVVMSGLSGMYEEALKRGGTLDLRNYSEDNKEAILR